MVCFPRFSTASMLASVLAASLVSGAAARELPAVAVAAVEVELPLESVTLFSSGVGFFCHGGPVPAGGEVRLDFTVEELNDVLKSLSLTGAAGGASVSYPGQADLDQRLAGFGVDLRGVRGRFDLLGRLRGVEVVVTRAGGGAALAGRVLGVEERVVSEGENARVTVRFVTLATTQGLAEVGLDQIDRVEVRDARLAAELAAALELLARARDTRKKPVTVRFAQAAERVGLSYLQASPLWKLSYRLDLSGLTDGGADGQAQLQGWAVVDNTTDRDWDRVAVTLVSGRPVSFVQDLYAPEFLTRPVVRPERYAGLGPQRYDQALDEEAAAQPVQALEATKMRLHQRARGVAAGSKAGSVFSDRFDYAAPELALASVEAAADAGVVGELFAYTLSKPVSLARGDSAMLPVVQQGVQARAVSVFNDRVQAKHPMRGVRLTNTTDLKLDAGPVTVLDGGTYAGDAQLGFLAPGADRLLTYALDLEVVVDAQDHHHTVQTGGRLERGVLVLDRRQEIRRTYTVKNTAGSSRDVLIEHARRGGFALVDAPQGVETTGELYRLPVEVPAGQTVKAVAKQVRTTEQKVRLGGLSAAQLVTHARGGALPDRVVDQLQQAAELQRAVARAERELADADDARDRIVTEQKRLRENMRNLNRTNALYQRYLEKLNIQEDQLEVLQGRRGGLEAQVQARRDAFEGFVSRVK